MLASLPGAGETLNTPAGVLSGGKSLLLDGMPLTPGGDDADLHACVLRGGEEIDNADFHYVFDESRGMISQYDTEK